MKKDKKLNFIKYFLYLQPFLDVLALLTLETVPSMFNISLIVRGLSLVVAIIFIFISKQKKEIWYVTILSFYLLIFIVWKFATNHTFLMYELTNVIKTFYFIYMLIFLRIYYTNQVKNDDFYNVVLIYLFFIIIPNIFNLGFRSYEITKVGSAGWFYSANDVSMILCVSFPFFVNDTFKESTLKKVLTLVLVGVASVLIGTKSILLTIVITVGVVFLYGMYHLWKQKQVKLLLILVSGILTILIGTYLFLPTTNFYKNIIIHLEFLKIHRWQDVVFNLKNLDHFVFSQRLTFLSNTHQIWLDTHPVEKIVGLGYVQGAELHLKRIEMDMFDIFYTHGLVGFVLYFYPIIVLMKQILQKIRYKTLSDWLIFTNVFLIILLSFIVGHMFTTPTVAYFLAILFIVLAKNEKNTENSHER